MERTYDVFADNGLYVLSHYLEKPVEDITYEDIENNVSLMGSKIEEFLNCERYSNLKNMVLFNSTVSNPSLKNVKLETALNEFLSQKGDEFCMVCGENHANTSMDLKGRSYLPNRPSHTFFNFSNNLHGVNICPYCLLLTTYSVMNCRVNNQVYLFNSSDDDLLKEYTRRRQEESAQDILAKSGKDKEYKSRLDIFLEMLDYHVLFKSEVEIVRFNNGKTEEILDSEKIYSENIKLLREMRSENLLGEFRSLGLTWMIVNNRLKTNYINYVYDFEKEELKCSRELFDFLNKEVNMIDAKMKKLVERITKDLVDAKLDIRKIRNMIKAVKNIKAFDNTIMEIQEIYYEKTDKQLFDAEEYEELVNLRKYNTIKNLILINLM